MSGKGDEERHGRRAVKARIRSKGEYERQGRRRRVARAQKSDKGEEEQRWWATITLASNPNTPNNPVLADSGAVACVVGYDNPNNPSNPALAHYSLT
jgi:hypothetical protein